MSVLSSVSKTLINSVFKVFNRLKTVVIRRSLKVYCPSCSEGTEHIEHRENDWKCSQCRSLTQLPIYSRYNQLFEEVKIQLIAATEDLTTFTTYYNCKLEIANDPEDARPVRLVCGGSSIRLNTQTARSLTNTELEEKFCAALSVAAAYRTTR